MEFWRGTGQVAVLRHVIADCDGRRIAVTHFKVQIADAAVEGEFVSVYHRTASGRRTRGELQHIPARAEKLVALLVAGRIGTKHKYGPVRAIADQPDARPQVDGARDPVSPLGDEDDATTRRSGRVISRALRRGSPPPSPPPPHPTAPPLQMRGVWARGPLIKDGLREQGGRS